MKAYNHSASLTCRSQDGLLTPQKAYELLLQVWAKDTCAPRLQEKWSGDNPTVGQCSITSFLMQDYFGGEVRGIPLADGNFHCFNVIGEEWFDLTSAQFGDKADGFGYENRLLQERSVHFAKAEKKARYELLKKRFEDACHNIGLVITDIPKAL